MDCKSFPLQWLLRILILSEIESLSILFIEDKSVGLETAGSIYMFWRTFVLVGNASEIVSSIERFC